MKQIAGKKNQSNPCKGAHSDRHCQSASQISGAFERFEHHSAIDLPPSPPFTPAHISPEETPSRLDAYNGGRVLEVRDKWQRGYDFNRCSAHDLCSGI